MRLKKYENNPILKPNTENEWENLAVLNPGAWYEDGTFYLLYRAAGDNRDHKIHLGLATSKDGYHFERVSEEPVLSPSKDGPDAGCIEDARIVKYDDTFFVTYAYRPFPPGRYWEMAPNEVATYDVPDSAPLFLKNNITNSGLLLSKDLRTFQRVGRITKSNLDDRDVILFPDKVDGKYVMLHRPKEWVGETYGCEHPSIWISYSEDLLSWNRDQVLLQGQEWWEKKVGGSTPPIRTEKGWLTLYHGVDDEGIYRTGCLLLDLLNPSNIIAKTQDYIMEPETEFELEGLYHGCVFPTGNVVVGDTLYVYYGAADQYCCVATCSISELVSYLLETK